ncbi:RloB-like protein [anaerobic digester metagenome]
MRIEQPYGRRFDEALSNAEPKNKYYIACEGKKTEYQYFKGLLEARNDLGISSLIEVIPIRHTQGTNSHPLTIIKETHEVIGNCEVFSPDLDTVCILVDRDAKSFLSHQFDKAVTLCQLYNFRFVVSNPCMEIWLLFHFTDLTAYDKQAILENTKTGDRTMTEIVLKNDFLHGSYNKTRIHFTRDFLPHVWTAIKNARKYSLAIDEVKNSLGTNIGLLVEEILSQEWRLY